MKSLFTISSTLPQLVLDESGKVLYTNEAFQRWVNVDVKDILYQPFESLIDARFRTTHLQETGTALAIKLHRKTIFFRQKDGSVLIGECYTHEKSLLPNNLKHIFLSIRGSGVSNTNSSHVLTDYNAGNDWAFFQNVFEQLPVSIVIVNKNTRERVAFSNTAYKEFYGLKSDYFWNKLIGLRGFNERVSRIFEGQDATEWGGYLNLNGENTQYYSIKLCRCIFRGNDAVACFIDTPSDILSDFIQSDAIKTRLEVIESVTQAGIWVYNLASRKIWWSSGVYKLLGIDPQEHAPSMKLLLEKVHPDDINRVSEIFELKNLVHKDHNIVFRVLVNSETYILKLAITQSIDYNILKGEGEVSGIITLEAENNLNSTKVHYLEKVQRQMAKLSNIGIWEWEIDADCFTWSLYCNNIFEDQNREVASINLTLLNKVHPFEYQKVKKALHDAQTGKEQILSFSFFRGSENLILHMIVAPIEFIEGCCVKLIGIVQDVTKDKMLEDELRHYQYLSQNVTDAIISTNIDLRVRTWNKAAEKIYGWTEEEAVGLPIKDLVFHRDVSPRIFQDFSRKLGAVGEWRGEMEQFDKTGNKLIVHSSTRMLKDPDGNLLGLVMVNRDLTNLLETSQRLDKYSQQLEVMFENTPGFIFLVDLNLHIVGHNDNFQRLLKSETDLVGIPLLEVPIDNKPTMDIYVSHIMSVILSGQAKYEVNDVVMLDGNEIWIDSDYVPIKNKLGEVTGVLCVIDDVTERMVFQDTIRENQRNLYAIIENADYALCYMDSSYKLKAFNTAFVELYSEYFNANIKIGESCFSLLSTEWKYHLEEILDYVMLGKHLSTEREMVVHENFKWIEFVCNPVMDDDVITGLCLSIRDIDRRKKNEQLLLRSKINETKIRSLATIQGQEDERNRVSMELHDGVGQILTALQMQSNYIQAKDFESKEDLDNKLQRLDQLVNEAKQEIRRISFNLMPRMLKDFGLSESVKSLCKMVFDEASGIFCHLEIGLQDERFKFEIEVGLFRVLQEITNNILKYSQADQVNIHLSNSEAGIHLSVSDNGVGFNYEEVINSPQEKNGLQNIKHRIGILGGTLSLKTRVGAGCAYSIIVPRSIDDESNWLAD